MTFFFVFIFLTVTFPQVYNFSTGSFVLIKQAKLGTWSSYWSCNVFLIPCCVGNLRENQPLFSVHAPLLWLLEAGIVSHCPLYLRDLWNIAFISPIVELGSTCKHKTPPLMGSLLLALVIPHPHFLVMQTFLCFILLL